MSEERKGIFSRVGEGFRNLTASQILRSQFVGQVGMCFGLLFATIASVIIGQYWYWAFFLVFALFVQVMMTVANYKQWREAKKGEALFDEQVENMKKMIKSAEEVENG